MASPTPSFSDRILAIAAELEEISKHPVSRELRNRIAVLAAELADIAKRPVSAETHPKLVRLQERLESIMNDFVMCDKCGNLFPQIAQLTLDGRSANLCASCAITALQMGIIELPGERPAPARPKSTRPTPKRKPARPSPPKKEEEAAPKPEKSASSRKAAQADGEEAGSEANVEAAPPETSAVQEELVPEKGAPEETSSPSPRRTAKRPKDDGALFKATFSEVGKHLGRSTSEVRQIGKLIEEISPPMDVQKTTHYVLAELRNARSKIPPDIVSKVVMTLKEGIPAGETNDGGEHRSS